MYLLSGALFVLFIQTGSLFTICRKLSFYCAVHTYHTYSSEGVLNFIYANILIRITHRMALIRIIIATYMKSCQITFHICRSRCFGIMHNILGRFVGSNSVYASRFAWKRNGMIISCI